MEIHGSAVLVIGATGGFGAEVARELAARGARLALHGRDPARLEALGAELGAAALAADLRAPGAPARVVAWAAEALDGLDVVVNVAGVVAFGPVAELEEPVLRELVEVNLVAPALVAWPPAPSPAPRPGWPPGATRGTWPRSWSTPSPPGRPRWTGTPDGPPAGRAAHATGVRGRR